MKTHANSAIPIVDDEPCRLCRGSGYLSEPSNPSVYGSTTVTSPCDACLGSGKRTMIVRAAE